MISGILSTLIGHKAKKQRGENYGKLCAMYESAKRPDLALKARLHYARLLVEEDRIPDALKGMASTCLMFPEEGAIIPGVLDQMDQTLQVSPGEIGGELSFDGRVLQGLFAEDPAKARWLAQLLLHEHVRAGHQGL